MSRKEETNDSDFAPPPAKRSKSIANASPSKVSSTSEDNKELLFGGIMPAKARTAMDILRAVADAPELLPELGRCPLVERWMLEDGCSMFPHVFDNWERSELKMDLEAYAAHKERMEVLRRIQKAMESVREHCPAYNQSDDDKFLPKLSSEDCTVTLKLPALQAMLGKDEAGESTFKLADFNAPISKERLEKSKQKHHGTLYPNSLLHKLFEIASPSPFGQVKTQKTVFDESVHRARQIDAKNFSVSPTLISKIEEIWSKKFYPPNVTAAPYKIKLYDPDGMFQQHQDTPETGLIGTFLVGLTDPAGGDIKHLRIKALNDTDVWDSFNGTWCAFYPDVIHSVEKVKGDCDPIHIRGTIAFKIFAKEAQPPPAVSSQILNVLNESPRPFGILLQHDYTVECKKRLLKGFDAALFELLSTMENCNIRLLPVLTSITYEGDVASVRMYSSIKIEAKVYPFNEAMIEACLAGEDDPAGALLAVAQWPDELRNIQFITMGDWNSRVLSRNKDLGEYYAGNEGRPAEEHSIYISAAIVVLPLSP